MKDRLFDAKVCERCGAILEAARIMSWFTEETICLSCSQKENIIKAQLRKAGDQSAMEGCGYVPNS